MKKITIITIILLLFSCGRWKVAKLKSEKLCAIESGADAGKIMLKFDNNELLGLSFHVQFCRGNIYTIDNILKRVQVLKKDGVPVLIIGSKQKKPSTIPGVKYSFFNFNIIGILAEDSRGNIYVQNRFVSSKKNRNKKLKEDLKFSPSYLLVFDKNGNLLYTLGQRGVSDIPFYYIEDLEIDQKDRLFVISRSFNTWSVFRFVKRRRNLYINLGDVDFKDASGDDIFTGRIEKVKIYHNGDSLLISVAYYLDFEFKYRKLYEYSIKKRKIVNTIMDIPEPKNEFYTMSVDKVIYLWDVENKEVKFIICNYDGNIINNVLVRFPKNNGYFEDILIDEAGNFYSYHVNKKGINIYTWR